ncbi:MAG: rane-bound metal-dependent hydrolase [Deltaproteobacteria bacterium]|nr:rane-bound metal-dependent hydrolase [Deltaproteobacteria bacterium]
MSPITHCLTGWILANTARLRRRDRILVTAACVLPDADGLGVLADLVTRGGRGATEWFGTYHHTFGHNALFALAAAAAAFALAARRRTTAALAFAAVHVHLLEDVAGARGPDGDPWPIRYLWPFDVSRMWTWDGQWGLNAWPNFLLTALLLAGTLYLAWRTGDSPVGIVSGRADGAFAAALRRRFGNPRT